MRTLIAIPCLDMMHTSFVISLTGMRMKGETKLVYSVSSLVYDSRNGLARRAVVENFDRVLWLDSDMEFNADLFQRLSDDLDEGRDFVSALCTTRKYPIKPCVFKRCGYEHIGDGVKPIAETYYDYPRDSVFECEATGLAAVMMNTSLLKEVEEKYGLPFSPMLGFGEDLAFCLRVKDLGKKVYCDSRIKVGHIGYKTFGEDDING